LSSSTPSRAGRRGRRCTVVSSPASRYTDDPKTVRTAMNRLEPRARGVATRTREVTAFVAREVGCRIRLPPPARSPWESSGEIMQTARFTLLDASADVLCDFANACRGSPSHLCPSNRVERVSPFHFCMRLLVGEIIVRDLGRSDGTRISGPSIHACRVRDGDELSIARFRYRLGFNEDGLDTGQPTDIGTTRAHTNLYGPSIRSSTSG
jgi:hypothetical protein